MQKLFGTHPVIEALKTGKQIDKVLIKQGMEGPVYRELITLIGERHIPYQYVPVEKLNREAHGAHQGVIAYLAQIDYVDLETLVNNALATAPEPIIVILDGVSDIRNLGAIARTLECVGGQGIIVPAKGGAAINAEAVKASAGALLRIDTCKVPNLRLAAYYLQQSGFKLVAATEKSDNLIYNVDFLLNQDNSYSLYIFYHQDLIHQFHINHHNHLHNSLMVMLHDIMLKYIHHNSYFL